MVSAVSPAPSSGGDGLLCAADKLVKQQQEAAVGDEAREAATVTYVIVPQASVVNNPSSRPKRSLARRARRAKKLFVHAWRCTQLAGMTMVMAALEIDDKALLFCFASSLAIVFAGNIKLSFADEAAGYGTASVFFGLMVLLLLTMRHTVWIIEAMDRYSIKYAEVETRELVGSGDDLGPASRKLEDKLRQEKGVGLKVLVTRSHALSPSFDSLVVQVLITAGSAAVPREYHGPNVKGLARSYEKIALDYDGDVALLKDVLRCSIICDTMADLCTVSRALEGLHERGVLYIVQVSDDDTQGRGAILDLIPVLIRRYVFLDR